MRILTSYIRNNNKEIIADDLTNPIKTFETTFEFLEEDITRLREAKINIQTLSVLHPWNYDL